MFFSQALMWKKGPLADIWMAAYYFNKLKKKQVAEINIASSVDQIKNEIIEISYRVLAHLLLGIVRIFSKKVDFLQKDCEEVRRIFTESLRATYWTNPQKSAKLVKKHRDAAEPSDLNQGPGSIEALRAQCEHDGFSVPDRFELDLFDLELDENRDVPDTHHQLRAQQDNTVDEREHDLFIQEPYQGKFDRFGDFNSSCFTPIRDVIPVEMIMDLELDINEIYGSNSSKKKKHNLNQEANNNVSVDQESTHQEVSKYSEKEKNSLNQEVSNNVSVDQSTHQEAEETLDLEPSKKEKKSMSKDQNTTPNLKRMETEQELLPTVPGLISPKLTVQTPVKRESAWKSKRKICYKEPAVSNVRKSACKSVKRKICFYDREPILSSEVMRETVHDASDLVYRRRKTPQTNLAIWRQNRFKSVEQLLTDPLIPCTFSKIQGPFLSRVSEYNTPEKLTSKKRTRSETEPDVQNDKSADVSDSFEKTKRSRTEQDAQNDKSADVSDSVHERGGGSNLGFESLFVGPTPSFIETDFASHEGDNSVEQPQEVGGSSIWSVRTRLVAQHLREKFAELKKSSEESCLSLEKILEGKRRKSCARFFYETLMLKGQGLIDVQQETPYGDIKISETPQFEEQFSNK